MDRRTFLAAGAAAMLGGCKTFNSSPEHLVEQNTELYLPGQREGHMLRDGRPLPASTEELKTEVLVLGSGVAGLTSAWRLGKQGVKDVLLVAGPEFGGNSSFGHFGALQYPQGAHYLPVPTTESFHVREILAELGILQGNPQAKAPYYDEAAVVHSPSERVFHGDKWQDGLYPATGILEQDFAERERFFARMEQLKHAKGNDGKKVFAIPSSASSEDPVWRVLDKMTFKQWLEQEGFRTPLLYWYVDYCCRDDFGAPSARVSAWAGLHYFCSRTGQAANTPDNPLLTWPQGLGYLTEHLGKRLPGKQLAGTAFQVVPDGKGVAVDVLLAGKSPRMVRVHARKLICAVPTFVAARLFAAMPEYASMLGKAAPTYAPWLITSFLVKGFPIEAKGASLSWDNVVSGSEGLGYIVNTHQQVRVARPEKTVFTTYRSFDKDPKEVRQWLYKASKKELLDTAAEDLVKVYGSTVWRGVQQVEATVRGHAMAIPAPGFRANAARLALQNLKTGPVRFAHADLSGFSIFEEASWWGWKAAENLF